MQRSERNNSGAEGVEVSHRDMTTIDFITELFCQVDDRFNEHGYNRKHSQAKLYPVAVLSPEVQGEAFRSEVVTLALLFALKARCDSLLCKRTPSAVLAIGLSIDGLCEITNPCFLTCQNEPVCFVCLTRINI